MAAFLDPLITQDVDATRDRLVEPLHYQTDVVPGLVITVPAGFVTDRSSIPRLPLVYLMVGGKGRRAAIPHDWLYENHGHYHGTVDADGDGVFDPESPALTRRQCDAIFYEAVRLTHGPLVAWTMYLGVLAGGWWRWGQ